MKTLVSQLTHFENLAPGIFLRFIPMLFLGSMSHLQNFPFIFSAVELRYISSCHVMLNSIIAFRNDGIEHDLMCFE